MNHLRLLALAILSVLLHLLAIGLIARHIVTDSGAPPAPPAPLAMRLQLAQQAAAPAPQEELPAAPPAAPAPPAEKAAEAEASMAPAAQVDDAPAPPAAAQAPEAPAPTPEPGQNPVVQMPGSYRSQLPPPATLRYTMTRPGKPAVAALLRWEAVDEAYTLTSDGVTGKLWAQGSVGDAGVEPRAAREVRANGSTIETTFINNTITIGGRAFSNSVGSQDRASLLLQLVGMGLSEPDQMRGQVAIYLAGQREPEIITFNVAEDEELATPLGPIATRHLVQVARTGASRLEIWLAPQQHWLPVQLRMTAPGGAVSTQTITGIEGR